MKKKKKCHMREQVRKKAYKVKAAREAHTKVPLTITIYSLRKRKHQLPLCYVAVATLFGCYFKRCF